MQVHFHSNYNTYTNHFPPSCNHVLEQKCSAYRLLTARTGFLFLKLSIKATFIILSVLYTTCSRRRLDMVFHLPTLRYWPFLLWYKENRKRNFVSASFVKQKWVLPLKQMFGTAMQSTLLTLHRLTQLPQMHFLTHASHSTVNGYVPVLVFWKVSSKKIFSKYSFWEEKQHEPQNSCSSQIKNLLFWTYFE